LFSEKPTPSPRDPAEEKPLSAGAKVPQERKKQQKKTMPPQGKKGELRMAAFYVLKNWRSLIPKV
jgi:hypothetical protein